jgi:hypothetical protein
MSETIHTIGFPSSISSIKALERTCNTNEINLNSKLKSLDTVQKPGGKKVTEAVFVEQVSPVGLGQLTVRKTTANDGATFKGKAFILTQPVEVSVFRPQSM